MDAVRTVAVHYSTICHHIALVVKFTQKSNSYSHRKRHTGGKLYTPQRCVRKLKSSKTSDVRAF